MAETAGKKGRGEEKRIRLSEDLLWGVHPVWEGLRQEPARFSEIILQRDRRGGKVEEIVAMARAAGIKVLFVEALRFTGEGAGQARPQGVVARLSETPLVDFSQLLEKLRQRIEEQEMVRVMVCDSLQDPHNLGAIIRSSVAAGAAAVLVTRDRSAPLGGTAAKASAGALSHIDICQVVNLVDALKALKKIGFWVFGAVKDGDVQGLYHTDLALPACLVVGGEGKGIRPLVKRECDLLLSIPMAGSLDSLNSSVAAAVILFEARRQALLASASRAGSIPGPAGESPA
jgi:23S rRNA (guanosine2251-2'-O)-methyltransferase